MNIVTMPAVVADAESAVLTGWLVDEGTFVEVGQAIAEIETDKATMELESDSSGVLARKAAAPGDHVNIGAPVAYLLETGEDASALDQLVVSSTTSEEMIEVAKAESPAVEAPGLSETAAASSGAVPQTAVAPRDVAPFSRLFISPIARKIAREREVDLTSLRGSGPDGRIIRSDVELALNDNSPVIRHPVAPRIETSTAKACTNAAGATSDELTYEEIPLTRMRSAIARRLTQAKNEIPHFYETVDVQVDGLLALRKQINESLIAEGVKVSVNDLVLKAFGLAINDIPEANVTWHGDVIHKHASADVSVAVTTEGGLITPLVANVEKLSLRDLCAVTADYKARAAIGRIKQNELEGGSYTLTNLGMYGIKEFTAIINPPHAGILAVGASEKRAVVKDDELTIATVITFTLSVDHRAVDGAVAAQLLSALKVRLSNPLSLLI